MGSDVTPQARLLTVREAAELAGVPAYTLKRRLLVLQERSGNVLVAFNPSGTKVRKWLVRPEALLVAMREDPTATDERLHAIEHKVAEVEARQAALRNALNAHKREALKWKKAQDGINAQTSGLIRQLAGLDEAVERQRRTTSNNPA